MIGEIITIGTEVTTGSILNTHSKFLSEKLLENGIEVYYHSSVDDNPSRIKGVIRTAIERSDIIITTGGLGPTDDDLTKEIISEELNLVLIEDLDMINHIKTMFKGDNKEMPLNNLKQGTKPYGSNFIKNSMGTAPGIYLDINNKIIIMLPGPPNEMKTMFNNEVLKILKSKEYIVKKSINLYGIGESNLEMQIKDLINKYENIRVATFASDGTVEIKIIGKSYDKDYIDKSIEELSKEIIHRFNKYIYGYDNVPIEEIVYRLLDNKGYKVGFCESCTGGLISAKFSKISGVSSVLDRSIVTYSNNAKIEEVNVSELTLNTYGAVSEETSIEMAMGLLRKGKLDIALSVTGIAGPNGGTKDKPVGLVYMTIASKEKIKSFKFNLTGNRESIQNKVSLKAFFELRNFLAN